MKNKHLELSELKEELDQLVAKLKANGDIEDYQNPMYDGPLNIDEYFKSDIKIVWVLKEAYDGENGEGGGWNYAEDVGNDPDKYLFNPTKTTWHPISYVSYGIQNNLLWDEMPYIRNDKTKYHSALRRIAIVNLNKLPAKGVTSSPWQEVNKGFNNFKDIIEKQLRILEPDIIIFGGTGDWMHQLYKDSIIEKHNGDKKALVLNKTTLITLAHPAARIARKQYVDEAVKHALLGLK